MLVRERKLKMEDTVYCPYIYCCGGWTTGDVRNDRGAKSEKSDECLVVVIDGTSTGTRYSTYL